MGLGITSSMDVVKVLPLIKELNSLLQSYRQDRNFPKIKCYIIPTTASSRFCKSQDINELFEEDLNWISCNGVFDDEGFLETDMENDKELYIELRNALDCLVVFPCSANTLAKLTNGICDNLLTSVLRAWDFDKPIVLFPFMDLKMYTHPITAKHIELARNWGYKCQTIMMERGPQSDNEDREAIQASCVIILEMILKIEEKKMGLSE